MLSRERVNKGTKRMNTLPLSPVVIRLSLRLRENGCLQILRNSAALNLVPRPLRAQNFFRFVHREHTILLSRERVNKGKKEIEYFTFELSPVAIT